MIGDHCTTNGQNLPNTLKEHKLKDPSLGGLKVGEVVSSRGGERASSSGADVGAGPASEQAVAGAEANEAREARRQAVLSLQKEEVAAAAAAEQSKSAAWLQAYAAQMKDEEEDEEEGGYGGQGDGMPPPAPEERLAALRVVFGELKALSVRMKAAGRSEQQKHLGQYTGAIATEIRYWHCCPVLLPTRC
jgi:hypothetical protein